MKLPILKLLLLGLFAAVGFLPSPVIAQSCNHPLGLGKNTEFIYQVTDKGKNKGTLANKVMQQAAGADGVFTTIIKRTRITEKKRPESVEEFHLKCMNDTVFLDAIVLMREQVLKAFDGKDFEYTPTDLAYPHNMHVGQSLPDGKLIVKVNSANASLSNMNMAAINRKVAERKTISTPAGAFDCFRLTYQYVVQLDAMGINTKNVYNVEEFYSTEHGIVKVQFTNQKGKKSKGLELISKKNPVQALQN